MSTNAAIIVITPGCLRAVRSDVRAHSARPTSLETGPTMTTSPPRAGRPYGPDSKGRMSPALQKPAPPARGRPPMPRPILRRRAGSSARPAAYGLLHAVSRPRVARPASVGSPRNRISATRQRNKHGAGRPEADHDQKRKCGPSTACERRCGRAAARPSCGGGGEAGCRSLLHRSRRRPGAVRPLLSRTPEADSWHSGGNAVDATSGVGFHGGRGWGARGRPSSTSPPLSDS